MQGVCECNQRRDREHRSAVDTILLAMLLLEKETGLGDFDHDDIAVQAWKLDSARFSMKGYSYPDNKRVSMELANNKTLMRRGYIEKTREKRRYKLTSHGRNRALTQGTSS